jgi:hypothetical protein
LSEWEAVSASTSVDNVCGDRDRLVGEQRLKYPGANKAIKGSANADTVIICQHNASAARQGAAFAGKADDMRALLPFFRLAALFAAQFKFQRVKRGVVWSALTFLRSALLSRPQRLHLTSRSRSQRSKRRRWSAMNRQALRRT